MLNRSVLLGLVAFVLATAPGIRAQQAHRMADRYTFKAGQEANPLELVIDRWSTDAERDSVFQAAQKDPAKTMDALKEPGLVGWIHLPGGLDHTIRYARRVTRPDGSVDIVAPQKALCGSGGRRKATPRERRRTNIRSRRFNCTCRRTVPARASCR